MVVFFLIMIILIGYLDNIKGQACNPFLKIDNRYPIWLHSLDETVDPCQDFYKFTCGQYEKEHKILFEFQYKINKALFDVKSDVESCLIDSVITHYTSKSRAVKMMNYYRNHLIPFKGAVKYETFVHNLTYSFKKLVVHKLEDLFPMIVNHIFVNHCFTKEKIGQIRQLAQEIKQTMTSMLNQNNWLSSKTKNAFINKLNKIKTIVGAVDTVYNQQKIDRFYNDLDLNENDTLIVMEEKIRDFNLHHFYYGQYTGIRATEINALNDLGTNSILLTAGILNRHNFESKNPASINYARLGSIIAHEMSHFFDNTSLLFDVEEVGLDLWTQESHNEYQKRLKCLVNQYSSQIDTKISQHLNGEWTLDETFSDNFGLKVSYLAYMNHLKLNGDKKVVGYEKYTNEQSFFISHGTLMCFTASKFTHQKMIKSLYPPNNFRLNVPLMNMPEFSKAFNCSINSPMNPSNKCLLF